MANVERHIAQWLHNRKFLETIPHDYLDWQVTACFYSALHAIDAAMEDRGLKVSNHGERNSMVNTNRIFQAIQKPYRRLAQLAWITRYQCDSTIWLPPEYRNFDRLVVELLYPVEKSVQTLIKRDLQLPKLEVKTPPK